mmetsp:Transcript_628/g.1430  ORF Transcript_628/g.1430 Transcript_628/m.1430 type:complete len:314 (+) Transcript_628:1603-2544(+)
MGNSIADGAVSGTESGAEAGWLPHTGSPVSRVGPVDSVGGCSTGAGEGGSITGSSTTGAGTGSFSAWIKCADPFVAHTFPLVRGAGNGAGAVVGAAEEGIPGGGWEEEEASEARGLASGDEGFGAAGAEAGTACSTASDAADADSSFLDSEAEDSVGGAEAAARAPHAPFRTGTFAGVGTPTGGAGGGAGACCSVFSAAAVEGLPPESFVLGVLLSDFCPRSSRLPFRSRPPPRPPRPPPRLPPRPPESLPPPRPRSRRSPAVFFLTTFLLTASQDSSTLVGAGSSHHSWIFCMIFVSSPCICLNSLSRSFFL